jgi:5'-3' exonuclease
MKKDLLNLLDTVQEHGDELPQSERYLLIDGLNLFFRNFSAINAVNSNGVHIGGLGGFFRSLGALIRTLQPTQVYMVFDGVGSSNNRKNIIPEYKANRNVSRITKHELFDNLEDEDDSKVDQIVRIIQYLKTLPVKTVSLPRVEADDIIAYLSSTLPTQPEDRVFIVSSDKDYLQLVSEKVIVYRPIEKEYYTTDTVKEKFNVTPHNFLLYKLLMGDNSDGVTGIKGLGSKGLFKRFPEIATRDLSFDDLLDIAEAKLKEHIIYARVLHDVPLLEDKYRVMDLSNPMMDDKDKMFIDKFVENPHLNFLPETFVEMCEEDQIGNLIRNTDYWVRDIFKDLLENQQ